MLSNLEIICNAALVPREVLNCLEDERGQQSLRRYILQPFQHGNKNSNIQQDWGSIWSSLTYGLGTSYRLTKEQCWTVSCPYPHWRPAFLN